MSPEDDGLQTPDLTDNLESPRSSPEAESKKRKRTEDAKPISRRAAKRKKSKATSDPLDEALDIEKGINHAIGHMDPQLLADHVAQRNRRNQKELSTVELEDLRIPANAIEDSTEWTQPRDLEKLPKFLEEYAQRSHKTKNIFLKSASKNKSSPHTLIVAGAGIRAANLTRAVRQFQTKDAKVEKLFAKHIKMEEAIESVKKCRINIGVGTPQRIIDLLNDGALKSGSLKRIVVDASYIDSKKRGILDMKETLVPLMNLLRREEFLERYASSENKLQLLFY
ncbi:hypothetical protein B9Z65_1471 [Elsinoe australis]|uniref:U3-containing 90S pre-ribosomal complex subunit-domain containing protein n=1 Tax=Elsinoe australis TaxID=40998 RepID=A0A2P7YG01_9PEZI|nr:hypothetical protein B9Z65_1471 [Elsinoe australis]